MVTRAHCAQFVGQHVVFQTRDGVHHGILQNVAADGILVRPVRGGTTRLAAGEEDAARGAVLLENVPQTAEDIQEAWFPFFFFPFFALAWLSPWAWYW